MVKLAYKHYLQDPDPRETTCCNCLQKSASWYCIADKKAEDCKDYKHDTCCWLCSNCLHALGAQW